MGKKIDRFTLFILSAMVFYLFFLNTWHNIPLACALAFICCVLLNYILCRRPAHFKCTKAQANAEILRIACLSEEDALSEVEKLLRFRYPNEAFKTALLLKHPLCSISTGDAFSIWKKYIGEENIVIAATCPADGRAIAYSKELKQPRIAIVDSRQLSHIIRISGLCASPSRFTMKETFQKVRHRFISCRITGKNAFFALTLLTMYLLMGNPLYLFLSLAILFLFGINIFNNRGRSRLF